MTPEHMKELFNYGVPTVLIIFVGLALWRIIKFLGKVLFDESGGLVVRYVFRHEQFLEGLAKRDESQQTLCATHATLLASLNSVLQDRTPILVETRDSLARLVELSEARNSPISTVTLQAALPAFKAVTLEHCRMCRKIVVRQMPDVSDEVCLHLDAMERIVGGIEE